MPQSAASWRGGRARPMPVRRTRRDRGTSWPSGRRSRWQAIVRAAPSPPAGASAASVPDTSASSCRTCSSGSMPLDSIRLTSARVRATTAARSRSASRRHRRGTPAARARLPRAPERAARAPRSRVPAAPPWFHPRALFGRSRPDPARNDGRGDACLCNRDTLTRGLAEARSHPWGDRVRRCGVNVAGSSAGCRVTSSSADGPRRRSCGRRRRRSRRSSATIAAIAPARLRRHIFSAMYTVPIAAPALTASSAAAVTWRALHQGIGLSRAAAEGRKVECASSTWVTRGDGVERRQHRRAPDP